MSDATKDGIRLALQAHVDSHEGPDEQVVDYVVLVASLDDKGQWCYTYVKGDMTTPHAAVGLVEMVGTMVHDDMYPVDKD